MNTIMKIILPVLFVTTIICMDIRLIEAAAIPEMGFREIPAGSYLMGSPSDEIGHRDDESPQHLENIDPFEIMRTEFTQKMWEQVMGIPIEEYQKGSKALSMYKVKDESYPMCFISWQDVHECIKKLNELDPKYNYRLPTEAEWEYACRAGTNERFYWGNDPNLTEIGEYAWYSENSDSNAYKVASKKPNAWGLFDMSGNVWEWCENTYAKDYKSSISDDQRIDTADSDNRVIRGGSSGSQGVYCRSANRRWEKADTRMYDTGFRLVRTSK